MNITITVNDENLNFSQKVDAVSFEMATEALGTLERNYARRVEMETDEHAKGEF